MRRLSDADALVYVLAYERCNEMAAKTTGIVSDLWKRDAEKAWDGVQKWLEQRSAGRAALAQAEEEKEKDASRKSQHPHATKAG